MPWKSKSAASKTKKAKSPKAKRQWAHVANSMLSKGASKGHAVRAANAVVKKRSKKS